MRVSELLTISDLEAAAREVLDEGTWAYLSGGAGEGRTLASNRSALDQLLLTPAVLRPSVDAPRLESMLFGRPLSLPVLLAPTSPQRLFHQHAELEVAQGAAGMGAVTIVSTDSHFAFHEIVAASAGDCWFQLYCYGSRENVAKTIDYAAKSGAKAIVITVDADFSARRIAAKRAQFQVPQGVDFGTLRTLGLFDGPLPCEARLERLHLIWDDLAWIRRRTSLPLLLKGILRPADAARSLELGVDGLIVSNHGGRQLDGEVPAIVALQWVAETIGGRAPILFDGGIRSGVDVVRALGLGATAVCIGRPYLWGLAALGAEGVELALQILKDETADAMQQLGLRSMEELDSSYVYPAASTDVVPDTSRGNPAPMRRVG